MEREAYLKGAHLKKEYPGKTDMELYETALKVLPDAGYEVTKKKPISCAVAGNYFYEGSRVFWGLISNIMGGSLDITIKSHFVDEKYLINIAEAIGDVLDEALK